MNCGAVFEAILLLLPVPLCGDLLVSLLFKHGRSPRSPQCSRVSWGLCALGEGPAALGTDGPFSRETHYLSVRRFSCIAFSFASNYFTTFFSFWNLPCLAGPQSFFSLLFSTCFFSFFNFLSNFLNSIV